MDRPYTTVQKFVDIMGGSVPVNAKQLNQLMRLFVVQSLSAGKENGNNLFLVDDDEGPGETYPVVEYIGPKSVKFMHDFLVGETDVVYSEPASSTSTPVSNYDRVVFIDFPDEQRLTKTARIQGRGARGTLFLPPYMATPSDVEARLELLPTRVSNNYVREVWFAIDVVRIMYLHGRQHQKGWLTRDERVNAFLRGEIDLFGTQDTFSRIAAKFHTEVDHTNPAQVDKHIEELVNGLLDEGEHAKAKLKREIKNSQLNAQVMGQFSDLEFEKYQMQGTIMENIEARAQKEAEFIKRSHEHSDVIRHEDKRDSMMTQPAGEAFTALVLGSVLLGGLVLGALWLACDDQKYREYHHRYYHYSEDDEKKRRRHYGYYATFFDLDSRLKVLEEKAGVRTQESIREISGEEEFGEE